MTPQEPRYSTVDPIEPGDPYYVEVCDLTGQYAQPIAEIYSSPELSAREIAEHLAETLNIMDELQASARDQARFYRKLTQLERREAKHQTEITANQIANLINQHSTNLQHNQGYQTGPTESQDWFNLSKRFYLTDRRNENLYRVTIEPIT